MREIRLPRDRADRSEFRRREPHQIIRVALRVGHAIDPRLVGGLRPFHGAAELQGGRFCHFVGLLRHSGFLANHDGVVTRPFPSPCLAAEAARTVQPRIFRGGSLSPPSSTSSAAKPSIAAAIPPSKSIWCCRPDRCAAPPSLPV